MHPARAFCYTHEMRRAGIDPGSVRTGVAVADDDVPIATPLCTLTHRGLEDAVAQLARLVAREQIEHVVVGLPLHLDGREGESARRARLFAHRLSELARVPVDLWDERLSSAAAARVLAEPRYTGPSHAPGHGSRRPTRGRARSGGSRDARAQGRLDQTAATLILQSYLDAQRDRTWPEDSTQTTSTPLPQPKGTEGGGHDAG